MSQEDYFNQNKRLWDAKTPIHFKSNLYGLDDFKEGASSLRSIELNELGDVEGKSLLHLQCHFGLDTLSFSRIGAEVCGVDISEQSINTAKNLAEELSIDASFICSNVYDLEQHLDSSFDIVFTSYGVINWLPDLNRWAQIIKHYLKPSGAFYMVEFHPFIWMLDDTYQKLHYSYFHQDEPYEIQQSGTYANEKADIHLKEYVWNHSLSDIMNALLTNGLEIEFLHEFPYSSWNCFPDMVETEHSQWVFKHFDRRIPYLFSIKAHG